MKNIKSFIFLIISLKYYIVTYILLSEYNVFETFSYY